MKNENSISHKLKKDRYAKRRGGNSQFLDIYCSKCNQYVALYQKDGPGSLLRMYLDRIFEPNELHELQFKSLNKKDVPALRCPKCDLLIGMPMVYELEERLAFRLFQGSFVKKKSTGIYPPTERV
jgi:hypothetical protein